MNFLIEKQYALGRRGVGRVGGKGRGVLRRKWGGTLRRQKEICSLINIFPFLIDTSLFLVLFYIQPIRWLLPGEGIQFIDRIGYSQEP